MNNKSKTPISPHDLNMVAFDSNKQAVARNAIYAVDTVMQQNYDALRAQLITHLGPVIVVQNDGRGGTFTLVHEGRQETVQPVSPVFELVKSVSHTALGIYVIIAPYLKNSHIKDWVIPLTNFRATLSEALQNLDEAALPGEAKKSCTKVLNGGIKFIDNAIATGTFTINDFEQFTGDVRLAIQTNMKFAAEAQVSGVEALLQRWHKELGHEKWKELYAVVLVIWTTEYLNQNWIILKHMMEPSSVGSHLITISTAAPAENTVAVALDNLARIVQDNIAAAMIFPDNPNLADSLKGPQDLLSTAIEKIIGCPHTNKSRH